jgi:hypothetical protein
LETHANKPNIFIYQIFYDDSSRTRLDPQFIGLDNCANERPDWFEFWPIRNFLLNNELEENSWYGFLSPNFSAKTGFSAEFVKNILRDFDSKSDVALFTHSWDQLAYFLNPFEHGESWHPGLMEESQKFVDFIGLGVDLKTLVTFNAISIYSNYIVAKPSFWKKWLILANQFYDYAESDFSGLGKLKTSYGFQDNQVSMKTFIQERLATLLLSQHNFNVVVPTQSHFAPISSVIFREDIYTRPSLQAMDLLKEKFCQTNELDYLSMYYKLRSKITFITPAEAFGH